MVRLLQKTLDIISKKNNLGFRYIIRFYTTELAGFGGLKSCIIELYERKDGKSKNVFKSEVKGKSDDIEELACSEVIDYLIKYRNGIE